MKVAKIAKKNVRANKVVKKRITQKANRKKLTRKTTKKKRTPVVASKVIEPAGVDKMIAECCGVHQLGDAVMFVAFYPRAQTVQIAGDFNNWQPEQAFMEKIGKNGFWQFKLLLSPRTYRYRLVIDGHWRHDPCNEATELNRYGQLNSVLEVSPKNI